MAAAPPARRDVAARVRPRTTESDFLERTGVTAYVRDVLAQLLQARPADPVDFIAEYFANAVHGVPPVTRALRLLRALPPPPHSMHATSS